MDGYVVAVTIVVSWGMLVYGWMAWRRERAALARGLGPLPSRLAHFLLPTVLGGLVAGAMAARFLPEGWPAGLIGPIGLAGASVGLRHNDMLAPDGWNGWGRVAALWLGFALLLPGALAWLWRAASLEGGAVVLVAGWVIVSCLWLGRWERLDAGQCLRFALRFYGAWLVVMLVVALLPGLYGGVVLALAYFASPYLAGVMHRSLAASRPVASLGVGRDD